MLSFHPNDFMPDDWQDDPSFQGDKEWPPFFKLPVLMLMLITLLNDGTLISIGYDNVKPSKYPNVWNLRVLFTVRGSFSIILAFLSSDKLFTFRRCLLYWRELHCFLR